MTTTDELIQIINQRLDITVSLVSTSPDLIDLRANSFGTDLEPANSNKQFHRYYHNWYGRRSSRIYYLCYLQYRWSG